MAMMGVSNITPAFPKMIEALHLNPEKIGLVIALFTLPGIILAPIIGVLADRIGRKIILVISLAIFTAAGTACFWVNDFSVLLLLRFIQGIGAAPLSSLNVTIIGDIYTGKERTTVMGYNASVLSLGNAVYPAIGGALAVIGWNYPFLLTLLALPVGILTAVWLKNPEVKSDQSLGDYLKSASQALKSREAIILYICSTITFIILYGAFLLYIPILLKARFSASPLTIGIVLSIMSLSTAIFSALIGRLLKRYSEKTLLKFSFMCCAAALIIIPFIGSIWLLIIPIIIYGMGHGLNFPNVQTLLAGIAPIKYRAVFMSLNGMVLRLGQTLGPLLAGLVYLSFGIDWIFFTGAILAVSIFMLIITYLKER